MLYQRSLSIERRLCDVLDLVRTGNYSTPGIAKKLGVSVPTVSRDVTALRERGHDIRAQRHGDSWHYVVASADAGQPALRIRTRKAVTA